MEQAQDDAEHLVEHGNVGRDLAGFDVPVAKIAPDEVVEFLRRFAELVGLERRADFDDRVVLFEQDFAVVGVEPW
jgi:hypothetical protein